MIVPPTRSLSHERNEVMYIFDSRVVDVDSLISRVARALPFLSGSAQTHVVCGASLERLHVSIIGSLATKTEKDPYEKNTRLQSLALAKPHPNILLSNKYMQGINLSLNCKDTVRLMDDLDIYEDFLNETDEERALQKKLFENTFLNIVNTNPTPVDMALSELIVHIFEIRDHFLPDIFNKQIFTQASLEIENCLAAIKGRKPFELIQQICAQIDALLNQYTEEEGKRKAHSHTGDPKGKKSKGESVSESETSQEALPERKLRFNKEVYIDDLLKLSTALVRANEQVSIPCIQEMSFLANSIEQEDFDTFDAVYDKICEGFSQKIDVDVKLIKSHPRVRRIMKSAILSIRLVRPEKKLVIEDKVSQLNTLNKFLQSNCYSIQISLKSPS